MAGEFQKDIKFDDVQVGDLILVELFREDGSYLGERRGIAERQEAGIWYFKDMPLIDRSALGYRLFKVTPLSGETPEQELARLRKIEAGVKDQVASLKRVLEDIDAGIAQAIEQEYFYGTNGVHELRERAQRIRSDIYMLEALLDGE